MFSCKLMNALRGSMAIGGALLFFGLSQKATSAAFLAFDLDPFTTGIQSSATISVGETLLVDLVAWSEGEIDANGLGLGLDFNPEVLSLSVATSGEFTNIIGEGFDYYDSRGNFRSPGATLTDGPSEYPEFGYGTDAGFGFAISQDPLDPTQMMRFEFTAVAVGFTSFLPLPYSAPWDSRLSTQAGIRDSDGALVTSVFSSSAVSVVPLPAAAWLFGSALGLFAYLVKRKQLA